MTVDTYLQVSHFSFPLATIIHECAVNHKGMYFTTHEVIRKNLKRNGKETLREDAKWPIPEIIHTFTMDGFLEFRGQGMGAELELETQRRSRCVFH